jgi:shikimate kinase
MDPRPIILIGFMGSGKSTVGRRLAQRLGWQFLDVDEQIVGRDGRTVERIFRESGERRFREIESEILAELVRRERVVLAGGGGLFLSASNRRLARRSARTVWLDVPLAVCADRVGRGGGRPLWPPGDPQGLRALFDRRGAVYALAELRLEAGERSADELVGDLLGFFD